MTEESGYQDVEEPAETKRLSTKLEKIDETKRTRYDTEITYQVSYCPTPALALDVASSYTVCKQIKKKLEAPIVLIACSASPTGMCGVTSKVDISGYLRTPISATKELTIETQQYVETLGHPIVVLLQETGAALFQPGRSPKRVHRTIAFGKSSSTAAPPPIHELRRAVLCFDSKEVSLSSLVQQVINETYK